MFTIGYPELDKHKAYAFIFLFFSYFQAKFKDKNGDNKAETTNR